MAGAADISRQLGLITEDEVQRLEALITAYNLPLQAESVTVDAMYGDIFHDKKTVGGRVNWVLMESIGQVGCRNDVPESVVRSAMDKCKAC